MNSSEHFSSLLDSRCSSQMMSHIASLVVHESEHTRAYLTMTITEQETRVCLVLKNESERQEDCHYFISDKHDHSSYGYYNMPMYALDEIVRFKEQIG